MARAAAKRRQPVRHEPNRRRHKDSGGQRFEDTLFFNRLRKQAKWVFVFLAVVFAGGFVLFGVGSSNVSGLSDIFNGIRGGGGGNSVSKAVKETQKHPRSPKAWQDLATAYDTKGDLDNAIAAWTTYASLRPKSVDGLTPLSNDLSTKANQQYQTAQTAQSEVQSQAAPNFGPPTTSSLGRALANVPDPIAQSISSSATQQANEASQRANAAYNQYRQTVQSLERIYQRIAALEPTNPSDQISLGDTATQAGDLSTALAAYRKFIKLAPYDNQVPYVKQKIKALKAQLASTRQG
jgi:tetratricopeptide (TPR) repeat protein